MRTGSIGGRDVDNLLQTIPLQKRQWISALRRQLIERGFSEEVEYDAINVEPMIVFVSSEVKSKISLKFKWSLSFLVAVGSDEQARRLGEELSKSELSFTMEEDSQGVRWARIDNITDENLRLILLILSLRES